MKRKDTIPKMPDEKIADLEKRIPTTGKVRRVSRLLRILGPGIVTGAADDDPSGIATYSQAGAQFGYNLAWTMLLTYPLMTAVQEACARIGAVTGKGLAAVIREHYSRRLLYAVVLLVVAANTFNIGSDIGAMAASTQLLLPGVPFGVLAVGFSLLIIVLEIFVPYRSYIKMLKWLAMALLAYFVTALFVNVPWTTVLIATIKPQVTFTSDYFFIIVAILGTTISPYLFFWETSNVVEEEISDRRLAKRGGIPRLSRRYLRKLRIDTAIGMLFSNVTAWFIIIVGAAVLHNGGITNITSAADAAKALEPLVKGIPYAGLIAKVVFAVGVIGIGLQSIPVLAGSSSYAVAETFNWKEGLFRKFKQARQFYLVILFGTLCGLLFNFVGIDPIKALLLTAVFNGIAAVPLILLILRICGRPDVMGKYVSGLTSKTLLWIAFGLMGLCALALIASFAGGYIK